MASVRNEGGCFSVYNWEEYRFMMTIDEMKAAKKSLGYSVKDISALSGVPYGTLQKLFDGTTSSPRRDTLLKLDAFFRNAADRSSFHAPPAAGTLREDTAVYTAGEPKGTASLREGAYAYAADSSQGKVQGEYTLDDYLALPDERRVELIDGVFYDMSAPTVSHQLIAGEIFRTIANYIRDRKGPCVPAIAPCDVQLDCDDKTILQPDVFITCDRSKFHNARLFGAPDFIIEILSPSSRKKDLFIKLNKYQNAGVREYWAVDLKNKEILVYLFGTEDFLITYHLSDKVPIGIYDGDLEIDFADIMDYISWLQD